MDILLDPNVAYLLLSLGFMLAILALLSPGTGLLEIGAVFALLLAAWSVYNLPINLWALGILVVGVFPFLIAVRRSGRLVFLVIAILALVVGSAFLFRSADWWIPAVNPILALVVSVFMAGFFWIATRKVLETALTRPSHDLQALIGAVGEARTTIHDEGSVQVGSELWSARSEQPISAGTHVRIIGREGFTLEVVPESNNQPPAG